MNLLNKSPALSPLSLRFADDSVEQQYIVHHNTSALPGLRLVILLFLGFVAIPLLIEYYGFLQEGFEGFEYYLGLLPYRLGVIGLLLLGLGLTYYPPAIRRGQLLVFLFAASLFLTAFASQQWYGPWILLASLSFNFGLMLVVVACGLLVRYAAPLATAATLCWIAILAAWLVNPISAAFLSTATLLTVVAVAHAKEQAQRRAWSAQASLAEEKKISENLLLNVLPASIAERMLGGEQLIADKHEQVAVVFADIVNFTTLADSTPPEALVQILDDIFTRFDRIAEELDLEKIKTIGDAYMMAAGLPIERPVNPALAAEAALRMREAVLEVNQARQIEIDMRAGIHVGEVVAGVIGQSKFVYDLWGDVVNVASRMESTAPNGEIQVTEQMRERVADSFDFTPRGGIDVKGKGPMSTWILVGRKAKTAG
jgi:class 3 adenylate cyclase